MRSRLRGLLVPAALFATYAYFYQAGGWNQNSRFALIRAIVEHGTVRIDDTVEHDGRLVTGDLARHRGHFYSDKAPGLALAAVPAVAFARAFVGDPISRRSLAMLSYVATLAVAALPAVVAVLLLFSLARALGAGSAGAAFAAATFGIGTPQWCYATLLFGHALSSACLVAAFAAAVALASVRENPRREKLLAAGAGGAVGWAIITEYPAAVPGAIIGLFALSGAWSGDLARRVRIGMGFGAGVFACLLVLAAYNIAAFDTPFAIGYANVQGFMGMHKGVLGVTYPKANVLIEILLGSHRGLLPLAPVLAFAPIGFVELIRSSASRRAGIAALAIVLYYVLFNAAYVYWDGGWSYGPRHMSPALPFACLALSPLWMRARSRGRAMLVAIALYGAVLAFVAVSTTAQPPEEVASPVADLLWPAFARGELSLNHQAIFEPAVSRNRDPATHAWNVGEKFGLIGHVSLAPLLLVWGLLGAVWWRSVKASSHKDKRAGM